MTWHTIEWEGGRMIVCEHNGWRYGYLIKNTDSRDHDAKFRIWQGLASIKRAIERATA